MSALARILCAINLEKASGRAFDRALNLAVVSGAKLHLFTRHRRTFRSRGARVSDSDT